MKINNLVIDSMLEAGFDLYQIKDALEEGECLKKEGITIKEAEEAFDIIKRLVK